MIDGFKIDLTGEELVRHLDARVEVHEQVALDCEEKRARLDLREQCEAEDDEEADGLMPLWPGYGVELDRRAARARRRKAALSFLRDHIVAHEVYRLAEPDLRLLELWPARPLGDMMEA